MFNNQKLKHMKKITLFFFCFCLLSISLSYGQDTCGAPGIATIGINSVGTINGTVENGCSWPTAGTFGEWYSYTATVDGVVTITSDLAQNDGATNSDDTRLSVFTGSCGALTCLVRADDVAAGNFLTTVTFAVTTGTTYYLLWDDRWSEAPFDFELTESAVACPGALPFLDDFTDPNTFLSCWEIIDNDNDGFGWFYVDYDLNDDMVPDGNPMVASASWDDTAGALNPDNWLISPLIDLTPYSSGDVIELSWDVRGIDPDFAAENYSVYAATSNTITNLTSSSTSFTETLASNDPDMDGNGNFESRSLDISALAGQSIYIAFRHHAVSDQFVLNIDNIAINGTLSVSDIENEGFNYFYNKNGAILNLVSSKAPLSNIEIYSILGQNVMSKSLKSLTESIDVSALTDGLYLAKVNIGGIFKTIKFLKE